MTFPRIFCRWLFRIDAKETSYVRRGFRGANEEMQKRLEQVGAVFAGGYHRALEIRGTEELAKELNTVEPEWRGFAYEGAAMGLALLDHLTPWRTARLNGFLRGAGDAHAYMVHVGVGWVWARVPFFLRRRQKDLDPLLHWLAFDGWGFHEGYFHWPNYVAGQECSRRLRGYERRVFDQGLGRSFWFVNGGNTAWISRTISNFPDERRKDLWSGIGLAAVYAGRMDEAGLADLRVAAGPHWAQLGQGAAFAAKARQRAGNLTGYTEMATGALCGTSAVEAARLTDSTLENLPANGAEPAYEAWRRRIQEHLRGSGAVAPRVM